MSDKVEESNNIRSSAETDGQGTRPTPVSNLRGQEATQKEEEKKQNWSDTMDDETSRESENEKNEESPILQDYNPKEGASHLSKETESEPKRNEENEELIKRNEEDDGAPFIGVKSQKNIKKEKAKERKENKKTQREMRMQEQRRRLEEFNNIFRSQESWSRYLTLQADRNLTALELDDHLLTVHATEEMSFKNKLNNKNVWIIKTTCREQAESYLQIREVNGSKVTVTPHSEMNSIWGTMIIFKEDEDDEDRCLRVLEKRHKNVEEVKFITLPRSNTKIAKIKFKGKDLPQGIYMGGRKRDLKPYIPKPSQCHKCSRFGHYAKYCNDEAPACYYCASHDHESRWDCGGQEKCINCGGSHHARSQKCPVYAYNAQVKHLQLRTGMSIRDAKDELKEKGITDPYKHTTYAKATTTKDNSESGATRNEEMEEENLAPTQQFQETREPNMSTQSTNEDSVTTSNRFTGMREENLDGSEGATSTSETAVFDMEDIEGFWGTPKEPKPQRGKGGNGKRTYSPGDEKKGKESKEKISPPMKKTLAVNYSSTSSSEEDEEMRDSRSTNEDKGLPIPTIVSTGTEAVKTKEKIPNPFRREDVPSWENHPLKPNSSPPTQPRNDLEGVRNEMKKMYEQKDQNQTIPKEHPNTCGCEECFWKEKEKLGKLNQRNVEELIEKFIKIRKPMKEIYETHHPLCMCVSCIKEKVDKSKEETIKDLMNKNQKHNRDPRINKDQCNPK